MRLYRIVRIFPRKILRMYHPLQISTGTKWRINWRISATLSAFCSEFRLQISAVQAHRRSCGPWRRFRRIRAAIPFLAVLLVSGCGDDCKEGGWTILSAPAAEPAYDPANPLGPVGSGEEERRRLYTAIGRGVIAPAYADLESCARALRAAVEEYCAAPTGDHNALKNAWRGAMRAWQLVQHIAVGPIEEANRRFRMQFYPDSNDAVERGVNSALQGSEPLTGEAIANRSVGVQGLPALEYLIFSIGGFDDAESGPRRCELAGAVAANVSAIAVKISEPWQEEGAFIGDFVNARGDFIAADDVLVAILESLGMQSEFIADRKLKPALPTYRNVGGLESHYAENTAANIDANLDAFQRLFDSPAPDAYRLRDYLERAHDAGEVTALIAGELDRARQALNSIENTGYSLEAVVGDHGSRGVGPLYDSFQELADLAVEAAVAANVELGFNFNDGD